MKTSLPAPTAASLNPAPSDSGIGSTLVIASGTAFLMLASTAAVWTKVEPVIVLVARYTG